MTLIGPALVALVVGCFAFMLARGSILITRGRCTCACSRPEPVLTATELAAYRKHLKGEA